MNVMRTPTIVRVCRIAAAGLVLVTVCGCSLLKPTKTPPPAFYSLDSPRASTPSAFPDAAPTLIINPPIAAAGYDSARIVYTRESHKLEYFARSEWVDPPARMLAPLLVAAVEDSGAFRAVVLAPSSATGDLRLDTEIIRLQHDFLSQPSQVRFTLRAVLVNNKTRGVIARREFNAVVPSSSENPSGGVAAANHAVQTVLKDLSAFCAEAAQKSWTAETKKE